MFNEVLSQITGIFDRRFLLNAFFPCLIFWGLLGIVVIIGGGWDVFTLLQLWNQQDVVLKTLQIIGLITLVVLSANVLSNQAGGILRFFEGYWQFRLSKKLFDLAQTHHQITLQELDTKSRLDEITSELKSKNAELNALQEGEHKQALQLQINELEIQIKELAAQCRKVSDEQFIAQERIYRNYPQPKDLDQVMPTRLGNILRSAELYPKDRYSVDSVLIWPRLYHLLPDRYLQIMTEALSNLNFTLSIASLSGLFSIISGISLILVKAPGWLFLLCFWGGGLVAWLAYCSALSNASVYAEQVRVAFDLYRYEIAKQLRLKLPSNPVEEKQQWLEIRQLFYESKENDKWVYLAPPTKEKGT
jgi:hypothetical protein